MTSQEDCATQYGYATKRWTEESPRFGGMELPKDSKYPRWGEKDGDLLFETKHFSMLARPKHWGHPALWIRPHDPKGQNLYRKFVMEFCENFWTCIEAAGANMPYWRRPGPNKKYIIHIHAARCAGGWGHLQEHGMLDCCARKSCGVIRT